jgi:hypothetical protein
MVDKLNYHLGRFGFVAKVDEDGDVCLYEHVRKLVRHSVFHQVITEEYLVMKVDQTQPLLGCLRFLRRRDRHELVEQLQKTLMSDREQREARHAENSKEFKYNITKHFIRQGWFNKKEL